MTPRPFCRPAFQDTVVLDPDEQHLIELTPRSRRVLPPRRELSTRVGVLAALVIAGSLLYIVHDDTAPVEPALGAAPGVASQG